MTDTSINFSVKEFFELTLDELYEILRLRSEVFVVEQECAYPDIDNKDKIALHVLGNKNGKIGAQLYLKNFYETHGFQQVGEKYIEDGIPHIHMLATFHQK